MDLPPSPARRRLGSFSLVLRRLALAGAIAAALVTTQAPAASAATVPVTDLAGLRAALGPGCSDGDVVELDADVVAPDQEVTSSCRDLVLDLDGATTLTLQRLVVAAGTDLTITGEPTDVLTVDASDEEFDAGLQTTDAALSLVDLRVRARGGRLGAAIGGGYLGEPGPITVGGETRVTAVADANAQGAAVGGGYLADATEITIEDQAQVLVTSRTSAGGAALGGGYSGDGGTIVVRDQAEVGATARSGANGAAIGGGFQGDGGTISFEDDALVKATARSGAKGAAVGGGYQGDGGQVTVSDRARVTATSNVTGNIIGATVGGGPGADGADVRIEGGVVRVAASAEGAPFGPGSPVAGEARSFGTLRVDDGALRLPSGVLEVADAPAVVEVVVAEGAEVTGARRPPTSGSPRLTYATITGRGDIVNDGVIAFPGSAVRATDLTGNHYRVRFETRGTRRAPASPDPAPVTVFAPSFALGDRPFPARPTRPGFRFVEWNTRPGGQGRAVTARTVLPGTSEDGTPVRITAFAVWRRR